MWYLDDNPNDNALNKLKHNPNNTEMTDPLDTTLPDLEPTIIPPETSFNKLSEGFATLNISNSSNEENSLLSQDTVNDTNKDKDHDLETVIKDQDDPVTDIHLPPMQEGKVSTLYHPPWMVSQVENSLT